MSGVGEKDATRSDKEAQEGSQAHARPFEERRLRKFFPGRGPGDIEILRTKLNDAEYPIRSGRRGKCLILNCKDFRANTNLKKRSGTEEDVRQLSLRFEELGFEVFTHRTPTMKQTLRVLQEHGGDDYKQDDCFVCWILTLAEVTFHVLCAGNCDTMGMEEFMKPFCENEGLREKPKLFFIQACSVPSGSNLTASETNFSRLLVTKPAYADSLVACSTIPSYFSLGGEASDSMIVQALGGLAERITNSFSWGDKASGSLFVQAFCSVLETNTGSEDLFAMLMEAFRIVALCYKVNMPLYIPCVTSTLTRRVRFPRIRQM